MKPIGPTPTSRPLNATFLTMTLLVMTLGLTPPCPGEPGLAPTGRGQATTATEPWQVVLVGRETLARHAALPLDPTLVTDFTNAWVWTADHPPRRLETQQLVGESKTVPLAEGTLSSLHLRIRDPRAEEQPGEPLPPLTLVAAPTSMWSEVPEHLLPRWPVGATGLALPRTAGESWRLRVADEDEGVGSPWLDVAPERRELTIAALPAEDRVCEVVDPEGHPLPGALATLLPGPGARNLGTPTAHLAADSLGLLHFTALPNGTDFGLVVSEPSHASMATAIRVESLPQRLRLEPGGTVIGRFVDPSGRPIPQVEVQAEGWIGGTLSALARRRELSDAEGRFRLKGLPRGQIALASKARDLASRTAQLELSGQFLDLGDIRLSEGIELRLRVVDDMGSPVSGVRIGASAHRTTTTDASGRARIVDLQVAPVALGLEAEGHLATQARLVPPFGDEEMLVLPRAFRLTGRWLDAEGLPLDQGRVRVDTGTRYREETTDGDGWFALDLEPDRRHTLRLSSPTSEEIRQSIPPGKAGATRDLGELRTPPGLVARGRLIDTATGEPVVGGQIWTLRQTSEGEVVAWGQRDLLMTRSDPRGYFVLRGLARRPALLRAEAPGRARRHIDLVPPRERTGSADGEIVELGEIALDPGARLRVLADPETSVGAVARVDLIGKWREGDMLSAPLHDGEATIDHVPSGLTVVTVLAGRELLCEESLELADDDFEAVVDCQRDEKKVSGLVLLGEHPASAGVLQWRLPLAEPPAGLIVNQVSGSGLVRQEVYGAGRPQVDVTVDGTGFFTTRQLRAGRWEAQWVGEDGERAGPELVDLAELDDQQLTLRFSAGRLTGRVLDGVGQPVARARVRELESGANSLSDSEGRFILAGLETGPLRLHARFENVTSEVLALDMATRTAGEEIVLILDERPEDHLQLRVIDEGGRGLPGAFVFLEDDLGSRRLLTADSEGKVDITLPPEGPSFLRLAASDLERWIFGDWTEVARMPEEILLEIPPGGGLVISSLEASGPPKLVTARGWELDRLLLQLGRRTEVRPAQPLHLDGLPPGTYTVELAGERLQTNVGLDQLAQIELGGGN